jgi:hypothetical protein
MVNLKNLLTTLRYEIRPFGPASVRASDCFGFWGRLQLFEKVAQIKQILYKYGGRQFDLELCLLLDV